jgi:molybdopterin-guanine dinucleotide biosynthesis protein A
VTRHVERAFVSARSGQASESTRANKPLIIDSVDGEGPIVGIRSALAAYPHVAWLVLACDLPFLSDVTLRRLLAGRDPNALATGFRSAHDGLPEPLCAIWEPAAGQALSTYRDGGGHCPRKFLIRHAVKLLDLDDPRALDNINTPDEYTQAQASFATAATAATAPVPAAPRHLAVQYFALMREQAGRSHDTVETTAATAADLYAELSARHGFTLAREQLKVAVNSEFAEWSHPLAAGDTVVFIPPVAGG